MYLLRQYKILADMIQNFSFWQQVTSGTGTSFSFTAYSDLSSFTNCETSIINQINAQSLSLIGADTKKVLDYMVRRLTTVTPDINNNNTWGAYGVTSINYNLTYPTKSPDPIVPTGHNEVTFQIKKTSDLSTVASGTLYFLDNDPLSESYIEIDFIISQVI